MHPQPTLVSVNEACRLTSLSRSMLFRYRAQSRFPKAVTVGERKLAFVRSEVDAWVMARIAERDGGIAS